MTEKKTPGNSTEESKNEKVFISWATFSRNKQGAVDLIKKHGALYINVDTSAPIKLTIAEVN